MATDVNTLSKLLQALAERRWDDAVTLGTALAKREERQGHFQAARRLRGALELPAVGQFHSSLK